MGQHMMELGDKEEAAKQEAGAAAGSPVSPEDQAHLDKIMQDPEGVTVEFRLSAYATLGVSDLARLLCAHALIHPSIHG